MIARGFIISAELLLGKLNVVNGSTLSREWKLDPTFDLLHSIQTEVNSPEPMCGQADIPSHLSIDKEKREMFQTWS